MLDRLPITLSAPLVVGMPTLVIGLLLSVMWNLQSHRAVADLADQNIQQIHELASNKVADILSIPVRVCEVNAHLVRSGALDPNDLASWRPMLVRQARAFDMLSAISWGGADGRSAWVSRYANGSCFWALKDDPTSPTMQEWRLDDSGEIRAQASTTFEFDLYQRPWFLAPRDAGEARWSEPYVWVGGVGSAGMTLGISYGIPLHDDAGTFLGVVDADYSLNDLSAFLRSIEIGKTGVAALVTGDGRLLAVSNDASIFTSDGEQVRADASRDPLIAGAAAMLNERSTATGSQRRIDIADERHLVRTSTIGEEVGLHWTLTTIVPERDFTADIESGFRRSSLTSVLAVVLAIGVGFVAARWLVSPLISLVTAVRRIGQGDLETQVHLSHAPEYTRLAEEINEMTVGLQDRMRMRKSLSLAMEVQRNLLPSDSPTITGLDIAGHSTYCDETGGDYYDFLDVSGSDEETAVIAMGDVMGHGVAAAMLMATARGILRSRCAVRGSLGDFLVHLNEMLVPDTRGQRFMTMLLVTVSATRNDLRWASAGHGPPIIYEASTDSFPDLSGGGLPLGLVAGESFEEHVERGVNPGDIILAATDGLWEAKGADDELYGMDRVRKLLRANAHRSAEEISETIRRTLAEYRGPNEPDDDLTFVIAKVL